MDSKKITHLTGKDLTLEEVVSIARDPSHVCAVDTAALAGIRASRAWVEKAVSEKRIIYGITTGFGSFKNKFISPEEVNNLQTNIIRSHACGVGEELPKDAVRAAILLRANSLIRGYSGVRLELIEKLLELLNKDIYPYVPSQGSVGSSGDLAPLCHIMLVLIGEGECIYQGKRVPTKSILEVYQFEPITLEAKEGLALSNGTNVQTAILALATFDSQQLNNAADLIAALTVEVLMGSKKPFHRDLNELRGQHGQIITAHKIAAILKDSPIIESHKDCDRVQDAYSLRCIPQVHGASRDTITHVRSIVDRELNAVTDNPLIFVHEDQAVSGGNFHGEPIAQAADMLKVAISELANISERRTARMIDPATNDGLPAYLIESSKGGLHSGLMIPQYVAAALVSENKVLAHPASVDSIPTSANQEDHVSMGTIAARQAAMIVANAQKVLAIELLNNTQAYEFRKPLQLANQTNALYKKTRAVVPAIENDRVFYRDIEILTKLVTTIA